MPITLKIPLANLFPVIRGPLIHPRLTPVRQRPTGTRPVQVLALAGPLGAGAVLEAGVPGGEVVRPFLRRGGQMRVPD